MRLHSLEKTLRDVALAPVAGHSATMLKTIADFAQAQMVWAARQRLGKDVEDHGFGIKTEAMAELGRVMDKLPKATGTRGQLKGGRKGKPGGSPENPPGFGPETLEALGVDKKTANAARKLAALEPTELNAVVARDTTLAAVQREKKAVDLDTRLALPDAKFRLLCGDPPWPYTDKADAGSVQSQGAAHKYPTMSIEELCALDVGSLAEPDALLFLWVTSPLLEDAFPVIRAWVFRYRASFVWDKVKHNMGHYNYNSVRHELLLICGRGHCVPRNPTLHDSVQVIERTGHSEKPERFREIIDELYPVHGDSWVVVSSVMAPP